MGAAVAASQALKDKKTMKKVNDLVSDVKERAADYFEKEEPKVKKEVKKAKK